MNVKKGIILAGGTGTRLYPLNIATNKQLLPLYNKPVIYYPLTILMLAGIRDILIISDEKNLPNINNLLGNGEQFGIRCSYQIQKEPRGLPDAFILAEKFLMNEPSILILGDNFFYGNYIPSLLSEATKNVTNGARLFLYTVDNPSDYGVLGYDKEGNIQAIVEKPKNYISNLAITGLYIFDKHVTKYAKQLKPSERGELEITDLIKIYLEKKQLVYSKLGRGCVWYDIGDPEKLLQISTFVEMIELQQGFLIASPEEIALRLKYISYTQFKVLVNKMPNCSYKNHLKQVSLN